MQDVVDKLRGGDLAKQLTDAERRQRFSDAIRAFLKNEQSEACHEDVRDVHDALVTLDELPSFYLALHTSNVDPISEVGQELSAFGYSRVRAACRKSRETPDSVDLEAEVEVPAEARFVVVYDEPAGGSPIGAWPLPAGFAGVPVTARFSLTITS